MQPSSPPPADTPSRSLGPSVRILIRFHNHPDGLNYTAVATPRTVGVLSVSYVPNSAGECAFFFRNASGVDLSTEFCFVVH